MGTTTAKKTRKATSRLSNEQRVALNALLEDMDSNQHTLVVRHVLARRKTVNAAAARVRVANERARLEARLRKLNSK